MKNTSSEWWSCLAVTVVLAAAVFGLQIETGAYSDGVSRYMSDEPAHYVTGVMVHDYLAGGLGQAPMDFASEFYLHYPAVALGHWPPMFYAAQAAAFLVAGPEMETALALNGLLTVIAGWLLYSMVRPGAGVWAGLAAAMVFVGAADVQQVTAHVMAEPMMCVLALAALSRLVRFAEDERARDLLAFGVLTGLAILTKAVAWSLLPIPAAMVIATRRWEWTGRRAFWAAHALALGIALPWELTMSQAVSAGFITSATGTYPTRMTLALNGLTGQLGWPLIALGVGTATAVIWRALHKEPEAARWVPLALACGGVCGLFVTAPVPPSPRYLILAFAGLAGLAAWALQQTAARFVSDRRAGAAAAAGLLLLFTPWFGVGQKASAEFDGVARRILVEYGEHRAALVSSQSGGELILVAEAARIENPPRRYFLRASKFLASTSWMTDGPYQSHVTTTAETAVRVLGPPASLIVLHEDVPYRELRHHQLLREMVEADPERWILRETLAVRGYHPEEPGKIDIYELADFRERPTGPIEIDMEHTLGRKLRLDPSD